MATRLGRMMPRIGTMLVPRSGMPATGVGMAARMATTRARPFPLRNTRRAYSSPQCDKCTSTKINPEDFVTHQYLRNDRLASLYGQLAFVLVAAGFGLWLYLTEPTEWKGEYDKREMEREKARQKYLRKDTYSQIRELQKELQKIDPAYQPGDGACQWRAAGIDFGQYASQQLHELQEEMRKINPHYRSTQGAPRDDGGKSKSNDDLLHELQRALRKMKPEYKPGWPARIMSHRLNEELCAVSHAVIKFKRPPVKSATKAFINPDLHSKDAVESLAAKLKDPELRPHFRHGWNYGSMQPYEKDDIREMVDEHMDIFGVKWSREGNPFGTDDDDEI